MSEAAVDPLLAAARATIAESLEELRTAIDGLTPDQLNQRIAGPGTNPMAVIVTHALESTRAWLSLAVGAPIPSRDRPAEFRTVADAGFGGRVEAGIEEVRGILDASRAWNPVHEAVAPWTDDDAPVTAAWALLHAGAHLGEHVGHAHVMRDLLVGGHPA